MLQWSGKSEIRPIFTLYLLVVDNLIFAQYISTCRLDQMQIIIMNKSIFYMYYMWGESSKCLNFCVDVLLDLQNQI